MPIETTDRNLFIEEVAGFYMSLGYEVERRRRLGEITADLFIQKRFAGTSIRAAVECLCHQPSDEELLRLITSFARFTETFPGIERIVIALTALTDESVRELGAAGIRCLTYTDLINESVPLEIYARNLIAKYESSRDRRWKGEDWFVRPDVAVEGGVGRHAALAKIDEWLRNPGADPLIVLGAAGTGKSTLLQYQAYEMAKAFLRNPVVHPAPLLITLGEMRRDVSLQSILINHFRDSGLPDLSVPQLGYLARRGRIVILFDAFDEMADRVSTHLMKGDFRELTSQIEHGWKVLFTCRTQYFKDRDERSRLLGGQSNHLNNTSPPNPQSDGQLRAEIVHLQEFTDQQVRGYLGKARPDILEDDWRQIEADHNLGDLARHPLLLDMIVKHLPDPALRRTSNTARLYSTYVKLWLKREEQKGGLLDWTGILRLMMELAWWMWLVEKETIHYNNLVPLIERLLEEKDLMFEGEDPLNVAREVETASFLKMDMAGNFSFIHKSFREFFLAQKLNYVLQNANNDGENMNEARTMLKVRPIDRKVIHFLSMLDEDKMTFPPLQLSLQEQYETNISENALSILYWSTRIRCGMEGRGADPEKFRAEMMKAIPPRAQLTGAYLSQTRFEAVVLTDSDFHGADLSGANFDHAELQGADFRNANLLGTSFQFANLAGADFHGAAGIELDNLSGADLSNVKGL